MKVLMIGTDRKLFEPHSEVWERMIDLGELVDKLHILVFATKDLSLAPQQISDRVWLYPTNSPARWCYFGDAIKLGRGLPRPSLVTAQDPFECGLAAWRLSRFFGAKLQLQIHTDFLNPNFISESWLNRLRVMLAKWLLPKADQVRVVSRRIADSIKQSGIKLERTPIVLPVFVDVQKIKNAPVKTDLHKKYHQFDKIILMASRLAREKNIGAAITVMRVVAKKFPRTGLIIVGSGPEGPKLKLKAKSYKLKANVVFEPWTDDLVSYYKTADLFINTSFYEGYGRTLVEALAAGCPVISTDVGLVGESGYESVVAARPGNLAGQIMDLLAKPKLVPRLNLPYLDKREYLLKYHQTWQG